MLQKKWFKLFVWFMSTVFFLSASYILISILGPNVAEQQSMAYMAGMMNAMHSSLMGLSMTIESDRDLKILIFRVSELTIPLILLGFAAGIAVRLLRRKDVV
ncbi:MAG: hypothetical protein ACOZCL_13430 [Bacillota bacterium]